jgi:hypothetical protein
MAIGMSYGTAKPGAVSECTRRGGFGQLWLDYWVPYGRIKGYGFEILAITEHRAQLGALGDLFVALWGIGIVVSRQLFSWSYVVLE